MAMIKQLCIEYWIHTVTAKQALYIMPSNAVWSGSNFSFTLCNTDTTLYPDYFCVLETND